MHVPCVLRGFLGLEQEPRARLVLRQFLFWELVAESVAESVVESVVEPLWAAPSALLVPWTLLEPVSPVFHSQKVL
jgi:hypothetical protein